MKIYLLETFVSRDNQSYESHDPVFWAYLA